CQLGGFTKRKRGGTQKAQNRTQKTQKHHLLHDCLTLNVGSWVCTGSYICPRRDRQVIKCRPYFAATISYILCPLTRYINSAILLPVRRERNTRKEIRGRTPEFRNSGVRPLISFQCVPFLLLLISGCRAPAPKQPEVRVVRIVTVLGRLTMPLAEALTKVLPDHFPARVEVQKTATTKDYVEMLISGGAELAIVQTDVAYTAYTQGLPDMPLPQKRLRGMALLYRSPMHLIARRGIGVQTLTDLRGKRVFVGTDGNTPELTTKMILDGAGIS